MRITLSLHVWGWKTQTTTVPGLSWKLMKIGSFIRVTVYYLFNGTIFLSCRQIIFFQNMKVNISKLFLCHLLPICTYIGPDSSSVLKELLDCPNIWMPYDFEFRSTLFYVAAICNCCKLDNLCLEGRKHYVTFNN